MTEIPTVKCKGCNADIAFITTPAGKKHPINPKPEKRWICMQYKSKEGKVIKNDWMLVDTHESHFSTCPFAGNFRKNCNSTDSVSDLDDGNNG